MKDNEKKPSHAPTQKSKGKKLTAAAGILLVLALLTTLLLTPHLIMAEMIRGPVHFDETFDASDFGLEATPHSVRTRDDLQITFHEVPLSSANAVILFLSGIHNPSVTAFFGHADAFREHGYASVLVEMRAHGDSDGDRIELGYGEVQDVEAVLNWLATSEEYSNMPVIVYGLSMGGAVAINAAGQHEQIDGLVTLSAYASWPHVFTDNMKAMGAPGFYASLQRPFVRLYLGFLYGFSRWNQTPLDNIAKLGDRPALIMHSSEDSQIPLASHQRLMDEAPNHVQSWVRPGDHHFMVKPQAFLTPQEDDEYFEKVIEFLESHFGGPE